MREIILEWLGRTPSTSAEIESDLAVMQRLGLFTPEPGDDVRKCLYALAREDLIELLPAGGLWRRKPVRPVEAKPERMLFA